MARSMFVTRLLKKLFPFYFKIASLARRIPLLEKLILKVFFNGDATYFLPPDRLIKIDESVESPEQIALPSQVAEYFVKKAEHIFIMDTCACREAEGCTRHPHDIGCIFLGEAVLNISPQLGRLVSVEQALEHLQLGIKEGLVHMIGRNRIDSIWTGAAPKDKLMTICSCCSCCCLWRIVTKMPESIASKVSKMKGVQVRVTDQCTGCGACVRQGCFVDALSMVDGKAHIADTCRGCGRCVEACPSGAIEITIEDPAFSIRTAEHIDSLVDISGEQMKEEPAPRERKTVSAAGTISADLQSLNVPD